ncbi:MAG TPA: acyl carrier protein [Candidatus Azoamicus sp. OHIO2]
MTDTFERIKKIITEILDIDENKITESASLASDLNIDSLDNVEFIMALEEQFEIEIPDEDAEKILTVKDAVDYIHDKLAKKEDL